MRHSLTAPITAQRRRNLHRKPKGGATNRQSRTKAWSLERLEPRVLMHANPVLDAEHLAQVVDRQRIAIARVERSVQVSGC